MTPISERFPLGPPLTSAAGGNASESQQRGRTEVAREWRELASIVVPVNPIPKGRARVIGRIAYTPKQTKDAERTIGICWRQQVKGPCPRWPRETPLNVEITAIMERPKRPKQTYPSRADIDNLAKTCLDALNQLAWDDDAQIVGLKVRKRYGDKPMWIISVEEAGVL